MTKASISTLARAGSLAAIRWVTPILLATTGSAAADPVFSINACLSGPGQPVCDIGSSGKPIVTTQTIDRGIPGAAVTLTYSVIAKPGDIGSLSSAAALAPGANIIGSDNAIADVALDNIKIIDPGVPAGTPVNYDINFDIGGSIVVAAFGVGSANADVELTYNAAPGNGVTLGTAFASTIPGETGASGVFSAGVSHVQAHTPVEGGFVDQDVYAEFILATHAGVDVGPSSSTQGQASASADFLDPFSFPTDGPVFNFFDANGNPLAGATVNSSDGCIVNNRFLCGGGPTTVPEPSTWTLMLMGFVGLGFAGWRAARKRRSLLAAAAIAIGVAPAGASSAQANLVFDWSGICETPCAGTTATGAPTLSGA